VYILDSAWRSSVPILKGCEKIREATERGSEAEVKDVVDLPGAKCSLSRSPQLTGDV